MEPAVVIQRAFRKWFYRNAVCCITHEKLNYPCFIYKSHGVCIFYDYVALNKYFTVSGKFIDPKTRNEYTKSELARFEKELKLYFPKNELPFIIVHAPLIELVMPDRFINDEQRTEFARLMSAMLA